MVEGLRFALRGWIRTPFAMAAVVLSLALSLGVVATAYSLLDAILLRPFPFRDPTRLVYAWGTTSRQMRRGLTTEAIDVLSSTHALEGLSLLLPPTRVVVGDDPRSTTFAVAVDGSFLRLLGVEPLIGRGLGDGIPVPDEREVVISFNAWYTYFAARPDVVGAPLYVDGTKRIVVGVMPRGFFFPDPTVHLWIPHRTQERMGTPGQMMFIAVGRLASGRTVESARAEIATRAAASGTSSASQRIPNIGIFPLTEVVVSDYRLAVWYLTGASVSLLLIVMANVCAMLLTRADGRRTELAIRVALGATTRRLYGLFLAEQFVVTCAASVLGLLVAQFCLALAKRVQLFAGSRIEDAAIGWPAVGVLVVTGLAVFPVASLFPGHRFRTPAGTGRLATAGSDVAGSPRGVLRALVLVELTLTPPLLLAASLFFWSFVRLVQADWGYEPSHAMMIDLELPAAVERQLQPQIELTEQAMQLIGRIPDVAAVGMGYSVPIRGGMFQRGVRLGIDDRVVGAEANIEEHRISQGYFEALGTHIVRGREFSAKDTAAGDRLVVINEACAHVLFPNADPIGREIRFLHESIDLTDVLPFWAAELKKVKRSEAPWRVVGVVGDVRMAGLETGVAPRVYVNYRQQEQGFWYGSRRPAFVIRTRPGSALALGRVVKLLQEQMRGVRVREAVQMQDLLERSIGTRGSRALLSSAAALLTVIAVVLMALGVYALFSETISRREHECGVKMALGAGPWAVVRDLGWEVLPVLGTGLLLGVATSVATSWVFRTYVVSKPADVKTWLVGGLILVLTVCVASAGPLRRALRLDPVQLLRSH